MIVKEGISMMSVEEVRTFALSLPESMEIEHWGKPSFRIRNKVFAVIQEDGVYLVVKTVGEDRLIYTTMDSKVYSIPRSFSNMNYMIVNLDLVNSEELRGLLIKAWSSIAPKKLVKEYKGKYN
jgi:hypothetical protein